MAFKHKQFKATNSANMQIFAEWNNKKMLKPYLDLNQSFVKKYSYLE